MALIKLSPDTLIWLGVGHTENLSCISDETKAVLVDANSNALKTIERQQSIKGVPQRNLIFEHVCLAPQTGEAEFYHYNLSEYSALSKATGLFQLFPGIKLKRTETLNTIAVADFIRSQSLSTRNNTLRIDIIDQCLPLLEALEEGGLLSLFKNLELKTSTESLYQQAGTTSDVAEFLNRRGYELQTQDNSDPDLPILAFTLNPLWQTLQNTRLELAEEKKIAKQTQADQSKILIDKDTELEELAKAIADKNTKLEEQAKAIADKNTKLEEQAKAIADKNAKLEEQAKAIADRSANLEEQAKAIADKNAKLEEQAKAIADKKVKLEEYVKVLADKEKKLFEVNKQCDEQKSAKEKQTTALKELQNQYKKLHEQNSQLQAQIKDHSGELEQLKGELLKADAQITLIRDLFFKNNTLQVPKGR
jgi:myosin heavy subunit